MAPWALLVGNTPKHPETELRNAKAKYECNTGLIDLFKNHVVVYKAHLIMTGQNQKGGIETAPEALNLFQEKIA